MLAIGAVCSYRRSTLARPMSTHAVILVSLLAVLASACRGTGSDHPSSTAPSAKAPHIAEVIEWLAGERVRGTRDPNRDTPFGILTYHVATAESAKPPRRPETCHPGLVGFIPTPERTGVWFGVDLSGALLRYAGAGWSPVSTEVAIPPIDALLAFEAATSPLELLVVVGEGRSQRIVRLTIADDRVIATEAVDLRIFSDERAALQRFDSGRCVDAVRECLQLPKTDDGFVLMREPNLHDDWVTIAELGSEGVREARYADKKGTAVDVLTTRACTPPQPEAAPSPEPEAAP